MSAVATEARSARRGRAPAGIDRVARSGSGLAASEDILLDDGVNAPIAVDHLGDSEVNANRDQGDGLVFGQLLCRHQKSAYLAERIAQGEVNRRFRIDIRLRFVAKFAQ